MINLDEKSKLWSYTIVKEGIENVMRINAEDLHYTPSIESDPVSMGRAVTNLVEVPSIGRISFLQRKNYIYDYEQTQILVEIALLYSRLVKQKNLTGLYSMGLPDTSEVELAKRFNFINKIVSQSLRSDPAGAYVELKRAIRAEEVKLKHMVNKREIDSLIIYIKIMKEILRLMEETNLIKLLKSELTGYKIGDRSIYSMIFRPMITPDFMFTRLMVQQPLDGDLLDTYSVRNSDVSIFNVPKDIKPLYHLVPPEFKLTEDKYALLDLARTVLAEHRPKEEEFLDPEKMRATFMNIGRDLLQELSQRRNVRISYEELNELAEILVRYTVGFGLIEILLEDKKVQDITINSPVGSTPIFIVHEDYDECVTNIMPSRTDSEGWASKFRLLSGRPLDEANPVLDTELLLPRARARVAIIQKPLNPFGLAYALRRHRSDPWTYPLFIKNKMINSLCAGLLSFLVQGGRSILFAGTRSSGKTSILGATLIEIMRKYRIITIEDTLELCTDRLRELGYNIQAMKVRSALTKGGTEVPADEGIRTSLRMGDSSLIVGEIRSTEAFALFEAMRIGALANVVAGTIHGDSPYGVFDRIVNDLKVPRTSFKATDIIVISNPVKSPDGLQKWRRVLSLTEVRKKWEEDPLRENGFVDLLKYNSKKDELEPTDELINGNSEILKSIAGNVKEWAGDWDAIWDNIMLRAKVKETLLDYYNRTKINNLLEARFVILSNDMFHRISSSVKEDVGSLESKRIFYEWEDWLKRSIREKLYQ